MVYLTYDLCKHFTDEFVVSIGSAKPVAVYNTMFIDYVLVLRALEQAY